MQAFVSKTEVEPLPAQAPEPGAHISLRAVAALEVASVLASVFITTWVIIPLRPEPRWLLAVPGLLAFLLILNSHRLRGEQIGESGLRVLYFGRALKLVALPTLLACAGFGLIGYLTGSFHRTSHFWTNLVFLPLWGLLQQYVLQGFIYRRMRSLLVHETASPSAQKWQIKLAILATAAIFALAHAPNLMLMLLTLAGALIWSWVYERAPNLWALGLSHAAISFMLMTSLPSWLLPSLSVGYKHFLYQKF